MNKDMLIKIIETIEVKHKKEIEDVIMQAELTKCMFCDRYSRTKKVDKCHVCEINCCRKCSDVVCIGDCVRYCLKCYYGSDWWESHVKSLWIENEYDKDVLSKILLN